MRPQHHRPLDDELCPISDQFLGELYRSDANNVDLMIASIDPSVRAMLAMFCYRRAHLAPLGLAVAASCDENDLTHWGGAGGAALFAVSRHASIELPKRSAGRPKITLSNGTLYAKTTPSDIEDFEEDESA